MKHTMTAMCVAWLAACAGPSAERTVAPAAPPRAPAGPTDAERFLRAIEDAAVPTPDEVRELVAIAGGDAGLVWRDAGGARQLLVAAWMARDTADQFYSPAGKQASMPRDRPRLWVSTAPEAQRECRGWGLAGDALRLRMAQLLGLGPGVAYDTYVQLWVAPDAVFRPCPDPDPTDARCELAIDTLHPPAIPGLADYHAYFLGLYESSYRAGGAPWTRLGYTYDWAPGGDEYGVSELLLTPGAAYEVESITPLDAYCRPPTP